MTDDLKDIFNPSDSDDYTPSKPRPRKPERVGQPRAAQRESLDASLDRIVGDIMARNRVRYPREREQARRRAGQ